MNRPPEEILDVVDENDRVICQKARSQVHRLGLMHRSIHVLVFNGSREVFLQKRSMNKDRHPGLWDSSASGHLNCGEAYEACALRELREEIGLTLRMPPEPLLKLPASSQTDFEHVWIYRCNSEGPFTLDSYEVETGRWVGSSELAGWIANRPQDFSPSFRFIWSKLSE